MDIWQQIADGFVKYSYYCIPLLAFLLDCLIGGSANEISSSSGHW